MDVLRHCDEAESETTHWFAVPTGLRVLPVRIRLGHPLQPAGAAGIVSGAAARVHCLCQDAAPCRWASRLATDLRTMVLYQAD